MKFNKEEIAIYSAFDVKPTLLKDFYKKSFNNRVNSLELNWKWLNRTNFYENKTPLVLVYQNQVIAHSGIMPFNISMNNKICMASWYIDFKILPEFQRQGLGTVLIKECMKYSKISMAFCNEKSIGVVKKLGWLESFDTYMHLNFMYPFNHPRFVRKLPTFFRKTLNYFSYPLFFLIHNRYAYSINFYKLEKFNEKSFNSFFDFYINARQKQKNTTSPQREMDYVEWRIFNSPNKDNYYIYKTETFSALILLHNNKGAYIDILWVSDTNNKTEIKRLISTMGIYGLKNHFSYVRFYTSKKDLSDYIRKKTISFVRHPRFAYFSPIPSLFDKLKTANWDFELIDSDFERISSIRR